MGGVDSKIDSKKVAELLRVNLEIVTHLRKERDLPFFIENRYILHSEREIIRWRNRQLGKNSRVIMDIEKYFHAIKLIRFCTFKQFRQRVSKRVWLDGNKVIQYIDKHDPEREVMNVVADILSDHNRFQAPKCEKCGRILHTNLDTKVCPRCKKKRESEKVDKIEK